MRDIKYDKVLRKCRENDAAEMYVANTIWPTDEGPVSGKAVAAALATKQPLITPEHKLPAELVEGGGGSAEWGGITGDIADQQDLQEALGGKLDTGAVGVTVAGLVDGKVPAEELPAMDYIPTSEKGAANGVAELDGNELVPRTQLPYLEWNTSGKDATGAVKLNHTTALGGLSISNGFLVVRPASNNEINLRASNNIMPITVSNLDYAVRSVLPNVTTIPGATTAYTLLDASATTNNHSWQYFHAPEAAGTYIFPAVTNTAVAHRIKLTIDFTTVQTYSFEDAEGTAIVPLFTPTIEAGDVYEFDCEYSAVKAQWLIWPHKQGATSDDYVMQSEVGVANGVAGLDSSGLVPVGNLPRANSTNAGIVGRLDADYGISTNSNRTTTIKATDGDIDTRTNQFKPIVPDNLNYAVTAALTDANKISLTDAQKASAQDTIGAYGTLHLDAAPTTTTVGAFGQRAIADSTGKAYTCTAVTNTGTEAEPAWEYTWTDDINAKGGTFTGAVKVYDSFKVAYSTLPDNDNFATRINNRGNIACGIYTEPRNYNGGSFVLGYGPDTKTVSGYGGYITYGLYTQGGASYQITGGEYNLATNDLVVIGCGVGGNDGYRLNSMELARSGDLTIVGGFKQTVTEIPTATSEYTFTNTGQFSHVPTSAPTYTLPALHEQCGHIKVGSNYYVRMPSGDGVGYYAWKDWYNNTVRYTASPIPSSGMAYTNTALTTGGANISYYAGARTHDIILNVLFRGYYRSSTDDSGSAYAWKAKDGTILYTDTTTITAGTTLAYSDTALTTSVGAIALYDSAKSGIAMVGSLEFEDAGGNTLTPLDGPSPSVGAEICYLCEWSALQGQWTIMPIGMGGEA